MVGDSEEAPLCFQITEPNHPCFIVASLLDGVNNIVYFHAKYGIVTDDGSITNDIDMGMLTRQLL